MDCELRKLTVQANEGVEHLNLSQELSKAIATHEYRKHRLRVAIAVRGATFRSRPSPRTARALSGNGSTPSRSRFAAPSAGGRVAALHKVFHKVFHKVVGETVAAALDGRMEEARHSLALGGDFAQVSALLIAALCHRKLAARFGAADGSCGAEAAKRAAVG